MSSWPCAPYRPAHSPVSANCGRRARRVGRLGVRRVRRAVAALRRAQLVGDGGLPHGVRVALRQLVGALAQLRRVRALARARGLVGLLAQHVDHAPDAEQLAAARELALLGELALGVVVVEVVAEPAARRAHVLDAAELHEVHRRALVAARRARRAERGADAVVLELAFTTVVARRHRELRRRAARSPVERAAVRKRPRDRQRVGEARQQERDRDAHGFSPGFGARQGACGTTLEMLDTYAVRSGQACLPRLRDQARIVPVMKVHRPLKYLRTP